MLPGVIRPLLLCVSVIALPCVEVVPQPIDYHGWPAWRLANGDAEVVVVPAVGRIMRYALADGANALWTNAGRSGRPPPDGEWTNYGGDKVLMCPHEAWTAVFGAMWPPRFASELRPHAAVVLPDGRLRLVSPPITELGFRIVRDIALAAHGSGVEIDSAFEQVAPGPGRAWAVWPVAQVPRGRIYARLITPPPGCVPESPMFGSWQAQRELLPGLRVFDPPGEFVKLRVVADIVASRHDGQLFVMRPVQPAPGQDMAQLFGTPESPPPGAEGRREVYNEIELASARRFLPVGGSQHFVVRWWLRALAEDAGPEAVLAAMTTPP